MYFASLNPRISTLFFFINHGIKAVDAPLSKNAPKNFETNGRTNINKKNLPIKVLYNKLNPRLCLSGIFMDLKAASALVGCEFFINLSNINYLQRKLHIAI
jgi:hypothetical protein